MSNAGNWEIKISRGGYPVWCEIYYGGKEVDRCRHNELADLEFTVKRAIIEARNELPTNYKHEMD